MSHRQTLARIMPTMLRHEGLWRGVYRHIDPEGGLLDEHRTEVRCEFPDAGPYAYVQHNHFQWADGRALQVTLPGVLRGDRLWWDAPTFSGSAWESHDGLILLNLTRKDEPGAMFFEMITLSEDGLRRARTWHWFKNSALFKRTLCNEEKAA